MPLLDHFHPPLSVQRPWEGFFSMWASEIVRELNGALLPPDYFALPQVTVGVHVAVQILRETGFPKLAGVIELVSPTNKNSDVRRQGFAIKCCEQLKQGTCVIVVDIVNSVRANLHDDLVETFLERKEPGFRSATNLSAVTYRVPFWFDLPGGKRTRLVPNNMPTLSYGVPTGPENETLDGWPEPFAIGVPLPSMPLWLGPSSCIPVSLEESYRIACGNLRIPF